MKLRTLPFKATLLASIVALSASTWLFSSCVSEDEIGINTRAITGQAVFQFCPSGGSPSPEIPGVYDNGTEYWKAYIIAQGPGSEDWMVACPVAAPFSSLSSACTTPPGVCNWTPPLAVLADPLLPVDEPDFGKVLPPGAAVKNYELDPLPKGGTGDRPVHKNPTVRGLTADTPAKVLENIRTVFGNGEGTGHILYVTDKSKTINYALECKRDGKPGTGDERLGHPTLLADKGGTGGIAGELHYGVPTQLEGDVWYPAAPPGGAKVYWADPDSGRMTKPYLEDPALRNAQHMKAVQETVEAYVKPALPEGARFYAVWRAVKK